MKKLLSLSFIQPFPEMFMYAGDLEMSQSGPHGTLDAQ